MAKRQQPVPGSWTQIALGDPGLPQGCPVAIMSAVDASAIIEVRQPLIRRHVRALASDPGTHRQTILECALRRASFMFCDELRLETMQVWYAGRQSVQPEAVF